jgi:hypothetical protein
MLDAALINPAHLNAMGNARLLEQSAAGRGCRGEQQHETG